MVTKSRLNYLYHSEIINSTTILDGIINLPFEYYPHYNELKVFLNGIRLAPIEIINEEYYGDYEETNNNSINIDVSLLSENDHLRIFRKNRYSGQS
jgi:hypothetical protein